jgi:hypothetical protein
MDTNDILLVCLWGYAAVCVSSVPRVRGSWAVFAVAAAVGFTIGLALT